MKVKALCSFCGALTMAKGETRDVPEGETLQGLLAVGYVQATPRADNAASPPPAAEKAAKPRKKKANA